jgi:hypothetical protein
MSKPLDQTGLPALRNWANAAFVAAVAGKVLSDNNFSNALKAKLDALPNNFPDVSDLVTAQTVGTMIADALATLDLPTSLSELTNDTGYQTAQQVIASINAALAGVVGVRIIVVDALPDPADGVENAFYFVPSPGATDGDLRDEYVLQNGAWEKIGSTAIDLSDYWRRDELVPMTPEEVMIILGGGEIDD